MGYFTIFVVVAIAAISYGDVLGRADRIPEVTLTNWELEFASEEARHCQSSELRLRITNKEELIWQKSSRGNHYLPEECVIEIPNFGAGSRDGGTFEDYTADECELTFDNDRKLPYYVLESQAKDEFCLKDVVLISADNQKFSRRNPFTFVGSKSLGFTPLFHDSNIDTVRDQLSNKTCPEEGHGCPLFDLVATDQRTEDLFCMFDMRCQYIASADPNSKNKGIICSESVGSFTNYNYCCQSGTYGDIP